MSVSTHGGWVSEAPIKSFNAEVAITNPGLFVTQGAAGGVKLATAALDAIGISYRSTVNNISLVAEANVPVSIHALTEGSRWYVHLPAVHDAISVWSTMILADDGRMTPSASGEVYALALEAVAKNAGGTVLVQLIKRTI